MVIKKFWLVPGYQTKQYIVSKAVRKNHPFMDPQIQMFAGPTSHVPQCLPLQTQLLLAKRTNNHDYQRFKAKSIKVSPKSTCFPHVFLVIIQNSTPKLMVFPCVPMFSQISPSKTATLSPRFPPFLSRLQRLRRGVLPHRRRMLRRHSEVGEEAREVLSLEALEMTWLG